MDNAVKILMDEGWPNGPICPKCGKDSVYPYTRGEAGYRCSDRSCNTVFSVKSISFLKGSKFTCSEWLTYIKKYISNGRTLAISDTELVNHISFFFLQESLGMLLKGISRKISEEDQFKEAIKNIFILKREKINRKNSFIYPNDIIIFDSKNTALYLKFIKREIARYLNNRWIFFVFCEPEDVMSEMFVLFTDKMTELNGKIFVELIRKTLSLMWREYVRGNPKLRRWMAEYNRQWKEDARKNVKSYYIKQLVKAQKEYKVSPSNWLEMKQNKSLLLEKKEKIINKRIKQGLL